MFILRALGPLHYPSGDRLTTRINELPVTSELCRRHPVGNGSGELLSTSRCASTNAMISFDAHSRTSVILECNIIGCPSDAVFDAFRAPLTAILLSSIFTMHGESR